MPDIAATTYLSPVVDCTFSVLSKPLYWVKPWPTSLSADSLNCVPETEKLAASAPLARARTRPPATTVGTPTATAKRRQLVRPYAASPCASFTDPPMDGETAAGHTANGSHRRRPCRSAASSEVRRCRRLT